jgi:hypothetical protein
MPCRKYDCGSLGKPTWLTLSISTARENWLSPHKTMQEYDAWRYRKFHVMPTHDKMRDWQGPLRLWGSSPDFRWYQMSKKSDSIYI